MNDIKDQQLLFTDYINPSIVAFAKHFEEVDRSLAVLDSRSIKNMNDIDDQQKNFVDYINPSLKSFDSRLDKIESFDFGSIIDLTVLVTAINAVGTKVQKLVDLFNVTKIEPGTFTFFLQSSIKTQTDAIIQALAMLDESLNDNFVNYFSDWENGQFWKAFKEFDDFQMALFFEVFFENYRLELDKTWVNTLEVWNTTNGYLESSYNALVIITQWLKQIYEKPTTPAIVNVPPFDYDRLEKMLKKLEFGEITNEAGTNIWDFLKSLIDNLGEIITTQLKEFVNVLSEILDFLDKLIDKLIGLIVPKNLDFMRTGFDDITLKFNVKFDSFLSIATDVTNMFKPIPKSVVDELSFDLMGVPFVPKLSLLDSFVPKFRNVMALMLWFQTGWWAFRRFTGTGDVVNDN